MHDVIQAPLDGRVNGNMIIVGTTGSGKSTLMGLIIKNHIMNGRKIVWIDPENRNERLTRRVGGDFISLGRNGHLITSSHAVVMVTLGQRERCMIQDRQ